MTVDGVAYLVGKCIDRDTECSRQTEIAQLQLALAVDEEILGFEIAMQDLVLVAESRSFQELEHEASNGIWRKRATVAILIHILLQILLAVLEDEDELGFGVYDVV